MRARSSTSPGSSRTHRNATRCDGASAASVMLLAPDLLPLGAFARAPRARPAPSPTRSPRPRRARRPRRGRARRRSGRRRGSRAGRCCPLARRRTRSPRRGSRPRRPGLRGADRIGPGVRLAVRHDQRRRRGCAAPRPPRLAWAIAAPIAVERRAGAPASSRSVRLANSRSAKGAPITSRRPTRRARPREPAPSAARPGRDGGARASRPGPRASALSAMRRTASRRASIGEVHARRTRRQDDQPRLRAMVDMLENEHGTGDDRGEDHERARGGARAGASTPGRRAPSPCGRARRARR